MNNPTSNSQNNNNLINLNQQVLAVCQNLEQYLVSVKNQTPLASLTSLCQLSEHPGLATRRLI